MTVNGCRHLATDNIKRDLDTLLRHFEVFLFEQEWSENRCRILQIRLLLRLALIHEKIFVNMFYFYIPAFEYGNEKASQ